MEAERAIKELEKEKEREQKEKEQEAQRQQEKANEVQAGADASSNQVRRGSPHASSLNPAGNLIKQERGSTIRFS